jgi:cell division protein ZapA
MSSDQEPVSVRILDKEYLVACPASERDALISTARFLDKKMKEIRDTGKVIGIDRIAVMAALNISHELLQSETNIESQGSSMGKRIRSLQDKIEMALQQGRQMEL